MQLYKDWVNTIIQKAVQVVLALQSTSLALNVPVKCKRKFILCRANKK